MDQKKIDQFQQAVAFLRSRGIKQYEIGEGIPGVGSANFSKYLNEVNTITEDFLTKFYQAWGERIKEETKKAAEEYDMNTEKEETVQEISILDVYRIKDIIVEKLVDGQNNLINTNMKLVDSHHKLVDYLIGLGLRPPDVPDDK